jgi:hypothetical protein
MAALRQKFTIISSSLTDELDTAVQRRIDTDTSNDTQTSDVDTKRRRRLSSSVVVEKKK